MSPFTTMLSLDDGRLDPERDVVSRTLTDLNGFFQRRTQGDAVVYRVSGILVPETNSEVMFSTTVLEPGDVEGEYYMTKGHFHRQRDRSEIYLGLSGEGCLVMANDGGDRRVEPIRRGTVNYVPGGWAHRSVNVGDTPLTFLAAYVADAGHDYETIERNGFPLVVVKGRNGPEVVENPTYKR
jgi:glucose-6-phosphate isomerase, archaeal